MIEQVNQKKMALATEGINKALKEENLEEINQKITVLFSKELAHSLIIKLKHLKEAPENQKETKKNKLQKKLSLYCYA